MVTIVDSTPPVLTCASNKTVQCGNCLLGNGTLNYTVLKSFSGPDGYYPYGGVVEGSDGTNPYAGLVLGNDGALYGTTFYGGSGYSGTVFKLTPDNTSPTGYTIAILHSFTGTGGDGAGPYAGLVLGNDGALYGTTVYG